MNASASLKDVEKYWDSRPCNSRHSNAEVGTRLYFEEISKKRYFVESHVPKFAEFETWKGKKVLDVGCGIGTDGALFASYGASYTGVDLSQASLDLAKRRFQVFGLQGRFLKADVENLSQALGVDDSGYDLIWSFGVLHHTPSIELALTELRKLSASGSTKLKIMVYASNSWKQRMIDAGYDQPEAQSGCPIARSFTPQEIESLLVKAGFVVDSIRQDHIFPYRVEEYKRHEFIKQPWFDSMPREIFRVLEQTLGWHLLIDAHAA